MEVQKMFCLNNFLDFRESLIYFTQTYSHSPEASASGYRDLSLMPSDSYYNRVCGDYRVLYRVLMDSELYFPLFS